MASVVASIFGVLQIYDFTQMLRGRHLSIELSSKPSSWFNIAAKIALLCAKISLILSAFSSRVGVQILSITIGSLLPTDYWETLFGPNTIFARNPWHPRHVLSIAALLLALPFFIQSTIELFSWTEKEKSPCVSTCYEEKKERIWLTDTKLKCMTVFNIFTSRPVQHIGNRLCRTLI